MKLWKYIRRLWHTVRHLRVQQIVGRLKNHLGTFSGTPKLPRPPEDLKGKLEPTVVFPRHDPWNKKTDVRRGKFCFLNKDRDLGRPVNWEPDAQKLWLFYLHYFQYLHLLDEGQQSVCREWVDSNPIGSQPGWHPYPTSLRIINWCKAGVEAEDLLRSLYHQAAYLYRNLETHLLGNHLLENARALVFAGCFFGEQGEAPEWVQRGLNIYREQTPEQILDDGGHFERSPMYHALMLEGYIDVTNLLPKDHPDRSWFAEVVQSMSDFLHSIRHPEGRIGLFNDATREIARPTGNLLSYVEQLLDYRPTRRSRFENTGYYIHNPNDVYLAIDAGPVGPDYFPVHAHADIFSYELSLGSKLFIVDTGVYEYEAGNMRDYVRSTRAHNTVCVDGVDQVECWDSFRVARRYSPRDVSFEKQGGRSVFEGTFDGYAQLIGDGIEHCRHIEADDLEKRIAVTDYIAGEGRHTVESRIHLHPKAHVQQDRDGITVEREDQTVRISTGDSTVWFEKGWYSPEFGKRVEQDVVVLESSGALPTKLEYCISY